MAQKQRGEVSIDLAGKNFIMRPTYSSTYEFEEKAGVTVWEAMKALNDRQAMPMKWVRQAIHSTIKAGWRPSMGTMPSIEQVGQWIFDDGIGNVAGAYTKLLCNMLTSETALEKAEKDIESGKAEMTEMTPTP